VPGGAGLAAILLGLGIPAAGASAEPPAGGTASPCRVTIVEPGEGTILYGVVDLLAVAACPESTAPDRVQFLADGEVVAEAMRAPYRAVWEAGGAFRRHLIEAVLFDREGRIARDVLTSPGSMFGEWVRVVATPIDRVDLSVSVTDREGRHVPGLGLEDFIVEESGETQTLEVARPEDRPLSLAVLFDVSGSMKPHWSSLVRASPALARTLGPDDVAKVVAFSGPAYLVQDFTRDATLVAESMDRFRHWGGGTSLYDSLAALGTELAWSRAGRQAIIAITDGLDTLSRIDSPRLRDYLRRTEVTLEAFLVKSPHLAARPDRNQIRGELEQICRDTGGALRPVDLEDEEGMAEAFRRVGQELQDRYYLSYRSEKAARDGGWRRIEVRTRKADLVVRTRRGVIADRDIGEYLLRDLRRGDVAERRKAAEWLGRMRVPGASEPLLLALGDRSEEVRAAAALALGRLREPRAIEPLVELLYSGSDSVGRSAAEGLRTFGPAAVPALVEALGRPRVRGRAAALAEEGCVKAIDLLADIGDARAVDAIAALARPSRPPSASADGTIDAPTARERRSDARLRAWALWALGRMGRPDALPILAQGLRDRDPDIRMASVWALGESGLPQAIPLLRQAASAPGEAEEILRAIETVLTERRAPPSATADPE
jgi:VWFA-related protein